MLIADANIPYINYISQQRILKLLAWKPNNDPNDRPRIHWLRDRRATEIFRGEMKVLFKLRVVQSFILTVTVLIQI